MGGQDRFYELLWNITRPDRPEEDPDPSDPPDIRVTADQLQKLKDKLKRLALGTPQSPHTPIEEDMSSAENGTTENRQQMIGVLRMVVSALTIGNIININMRSRGSGGYLNIEESYLFSSAPAAPTVTINEKAFNTVLPLLLPPESGYGEPGAGLAPRLKDRLLHAETVTIGLNKN